MSLKIEQSFSSQQRSDMPSGSMSIGGHQMGGKQKYNSIDIAYDETNFGENLHQKNVRTNTNQQNSQMFNKYNQSNNYMHPSIKFQPVVIGPHNVSMLKQDISQKTLAKSSTKSKSSKKNLLSNGNNPYLLELNKMGTMETQQKKQQRKKSESLDFTEASYHQNKVAKSSKSNSKTSSVDRRIVNMSFQSQNNQLNNKAQIRKSNIRNS